MSTDRQLDVETRARLLTGPRRSGTSTALAMYLLSLLDDAERELYWRARIENEDDAP